MPMFGINTFATGKDFDAVGLLCDPSLWDEEWARSVARQDGIGELTDTHWRVIYQLREHYARFGSAPLMGDICKAAGLQGRSVHDLFQCCLGAWRVAGIPDPEGVRISADPHRVSVG
jgi:tRNA 2-thiouridine synthesizing protein E